MYIGIKAVVPQNDYTLLLTFENDEQRVLDMKPYLEIGHIFRALKDKKMFNTVRVSFRTIAWENNADLAPEILYNSSIRI
ncbi:MAG: DUF2442 domain-containing protein [Bacteroidetes bacterium]|nr:DUF2442 domain-containing protein [Bacteroidota bacterium]